MAKGLNMMIMIDSPFIYAAAIPTSWLNSGVPILLLSEGEGRELRGTPSFSQIARQQVELQMNELDNNTMKQKKKKKKKKDKICWILGFLEWRSIIHTSFPTIPTPQLAYQRAAWLILTCHRPIPVIRTTPWLHMHTSRLSLSLLVIFSFLFDLRTADFPCLSFSFSLLLFFFIFHLSSLLLYLIDTLCLFLPIILQ